jgi:hypothetical protein
VKEKHGDASEGKTREGIHDLPRVSGVGDVGEQRGKNHQRNDGGCAPERGSALVALPALFLRGQKLPLSLRHLCHEAFEKLPFLYPLFHLLTKLHRDIYGTGAFFFLPGKESHFMEGALLSTSASRVTTTFLGNRKGGLHEGFYLSKAIQSLFTPVIRHQGSCHIYVYILIIQLSTKKCSLCEEIILAWLVTQKKGRSEADQEREEYSLFIAVKGCQGNICKRNVG